MFCSHLMVLIKNPCDDQEHKEWGVREMGTGTYWAAGKVCVHVYTCPRMAFGSWLDMPPLKVLYLRTHDIPVAQHQPAWHCVCPAYLWLLWCPLWSQFILWWPSLWGCLPTATESTLRCCISVSFTWSIHFHRFLGSWHWCLWKIVFRAHSLTELKLLTYCLFGLT